MFMCPLVMVGARSGDVRIQVLGVSVFECRKLADLLSLGEWP
jgi:hypothetical protein